MANWKFVFRKCINLAYEKDYVLSKTFRGLADEVKGRAIWRKSEGFFELNQFPIDQDVVLLPVNYTVHGMVQITC